MERRKGKVYLKSGNVIEFEASDAYLKHNGLGELVGYNFSNVKPTMYFDIMQIAALTFDQKGEGSE